MRWILVGVTLLAVYIGYCFLDDFDPESVRGKRVLVTGASTGIGEQLAYHYARLGASVVITARTESKLQKVITKCQELGSAKSHFSYVTADMSDMKQTPRVIQAAVEKLGGLDILVLNHIMVNKLEVWENRPEILERFHKLMDINFFSFVHLASHALQQLKQSDRGGSIVVVSSFAGKKGSPGLINYSASKFALEGFFDGLRQELGIKESNVSVTLCFLGYIGTEGSKQFTQTYNINAPAAADPSDTALSILQAGINRVPEMYYPYSIKFALYLKMFAPRFLDYLMSDSLALSTTLS